MSCRISLIAILCAFPASAVEPLFSTNALSPQAELASFRLADSELVIEPVAAEPEVVSPVAIAFDAAGRLFIAEMFDYPNGPGFGRVKLLQDHDGDGHYEDATVFADGLPFPTSVLPWNGGVLVAAAPDIWFLKDTDGDGRADEKRKLFTGFGKGNQQLRVNGLFWGLDNWVYGANGRSDGEVVTASSAPVGDETKAISLRGHDFRFRPDTGEFEAIAGRSQFGTCRDDWGNRFLSWNTIPIRHEVLPERYLVRNPNLGATESILEIAEPGDTGRVFPRTPPPLTFNNESVTHFNASAGLTIYRGDALGAKYKGNAFLGETLLNLVHRRILEPNGVTFVARRGEHETEFLTSSDPWFHPVNLATGPDGALYVVDFYRRFVEHPDFVHGKARNEIPWRAGAEHGRLWRIRSSKMALTKTKPHLDQASSAELVAHLGDQNGWWRDTAQRLIVERRDQSVVAELERLASNSSNPLAQLHALYTLDGLDALSAETLLVALTNSTPDVREHIIRLSEPLLRNVMPPSPLVRPITLPVEGLAWQIGLLVFDANPRVRLQLALSLGEFRDTGHLTTLAFSDFDKRWQSTAILSSAGTNAWVMLGLLARAWINTATTEQANFLERLARLVSADKNDAAQCIELVARNWLSVLGPGGTSVVAIKPSRGAVAILAGVAESLARTSQPLRQMLQTPPASLEREVRSLMSFLTGTAALAASPEQVAADRLVAIRLLGRVPAQIGGDALLKLILPDEPPAIQAAAARALVTLNDAPLAQNVFAGWRQYTTERRRQLLSSTPTSQAMIGALIKAMEEGRVVPAELDAAARQSLLKLPDAGVRERFKKLVENSGAPDRDEVIRQFQLALKLEGRREHGAAVFSKACLVCHTIDGRGEHVGPDLSGIASRPREALLVDILDPSRQVSPDFINYTVTTTDGRELSGLVAAETSASVALRRSGQPDETVLRSQIKEMRAEGKSLMPDGLEQGLSAQDFSDLLAFLGKPEAALLAQAPITDQASRIATVSRPMNGVHVGTGVVELEADDSMIIAGGITAGHAKGQEGKLRVVATVLEKPPFGKLAIVACDVLMITRQHLDPVERELERTTGISFANILINCTHNHHAPSTMVLHGYGLDETFTKTIQRAIVKAVQSANANLSKDECGFFFALGESLVGQNSRQLLQAGEIYWVGPRTNFVRATGPFDPELPVLAFRQSTGMLRALIFNHSTHSIGTRKPGVRSPSFYGFATQELEADLGGTVCFLEGASGSTHNLSLTCDEMTQRIKEAVRDALEKASPHPITKLTCIKRPFTFKVRDFDEKAEDEAVVRYCRKYVGTYGDQVIQVFRNMRKELVGERGKQRETWLQVLQIGDVAIVGVPAELFTQLGLDIKNRSPFRYTYVAELANDWIGYLPNREGHKLGGYQVWTGYHSYAQPGTGERLVDECVSMLKALAPNSPPETVHSP